VACSSLRSPNNSDIRLLRAQCRISIPKAVCAERNQTACVCAVGGSGGLLFRTWPSQLTATCWCWAAAVKGCCRSYGEAHKEQKHTVVRTSSLDYVRLQQQQPASASALKPTPAQLLTSRAGLLYAGCLTRLRVSCRRSHRSLAWCCHKMGATSSQTCR
jgi:hypothetical protein